MKKNEIKVGGRYKAKVAGKLTTVRVDAIREVTRFNDREVSLYEVTNLVTNRKTTFRSAAKFRGEVAEATHTWPCGCESPAAGGDVTRPCDECKAEDEQRADPTTTPVTSSPTPADSPSAETRPIATPPSDSAPATAAPATSAASTDAPPVAGSPWERATTATQATARKHPLTAEQQAVLDAAPGSQVVVIEAGAGCGKTSTLVELANALGGRGQYTAFNANLVAESKGKMPRHCDANTIHSLAFRAEGYKHQKRLNQKRMRARELGAIIGVQSTTIKAADGTDKLLDVGFLTAMAAKALKAFCQSADREITEAHFGKVPLATDEDNARVVAELMPHAKTMWADATDPNGRLPFSHDFYVKIWQLSSPDIHADYILLDEAQDVSKVMLEIMAHNVRRGRQVFLVGDSAQQIYSWRGAINAMSAFPEATRLTLSQSFRFGPAIAQVANAVLAHLQNRTPLTLRGFDPIGSRVTSVRQPAAVLHRTNAGAVQTLLTAIGEGKRPHLIGGDDEVLKFVLAAQELQTGRRTEHPELACFESWSEVKAFADTDEGADLRTMVKLIDAFTTTRIISALRNMPAEKDADLVVSTCHKAKGREWRTVRLGGDFKPLDKMDDEELRLLYVATTRAQVELDVENCPPFCGTERRASEGWNGEGGRTPTIDISDARRTSESVATAPAQAPATPPTTSPQATGRRESNTWTKGKRGDWLVRGKPGQSGTVTVARKNGQTSKERLGKVIWQDEVTALYEVVK